MDYILKCNTLTCRRELEQIAVVTTCSHIFCEDCASRLHLTNPNNHHKICPACNQPLLNADDVVLANLNPTDDYKTSILSGLSPNTVMECAGRALNFWAYQTSQEILYQGMQAKALADRYTKLKGQMDSIIREANEEMSTLRENLNTTLRDCNKLKHKNQDLQRALTQKAKDHARTQELYDKVRGRGQMEHIEQAAEIAVDRTIHASTGPSRYIGHFGNVPNDENQTSGRNSLQSKPISQPPMPNMIGAAMSRTRAINSWNGLDSQESNNTPIHVPDTPSTHRKRLNLGANIGLGISNATSGLHLGTPSIPRISPSRGPSRVGGINNSFAGYGMSAGLKVSHTPTPGLRMQTRAATGLRVAQRPASATYGGRTLGGGTTYNGGGPSY